MAHISDKDRTVFREAAQTVLDNFNDQELKRIGELSADLKTIIDAAKQRQQDKLNKAS
jgi:hypothetical protein